MLERISAIALNTFRESIRDRILFAVAVFAIFLIASSSTIFLLFCEHSTIRNKRQRRIIEGAMGMSVLRYTYLGEDTGRPSFIFSVGVFILAIWLPVISMCLFQN